MQVGLKMLRFDTDRIEMIRIHASGVLNFLLDRMALWVGGLRKVGINLQSRPMYWITSSGLVSEKLPF